MKKALFTSLGILLLLILLVVIFWKDILATAVLYQARNAMPENMYHTTTTEHIFTDVPPTDATDIYIIGSIEVPISFLIEEQAEHTEYFRLVGRNQELLTVIDDIEIRDAFFAANDDLTEDDAANMCAFLEVAHGPTVCTSNYDFFTAILAADLTAPHLFSSATEKLSVSILSILRSTYISVFQGSNIRHFSTETTRGYIYGSEDGNMIVSLFASDDSQYTIVTSLKDEDLDQLLQGISSIE